MRQSSKHIDTGEERAVTPPFTFPARTATTLPDRFDVRSIHYAPAVLKSPADIEGIYNGMTLSAISKALER